MFKRRKPLNYWQNFRELIYPRSGWRRVLSYISYRLKRLPDRPHKIALGFSCGVFVCFMPFFGLHFLLAVILAFILRGNILAALLGTFFGNPVSFPIIAALSYNIGLQVLDYPKSEGTWLNIRQGFHEAMQTLWFNLKSIFSDYSANWDGMYSFFNVIVIPYSIGGLVPGLICSTIIYFMAKSLIFAYQNRRKKIILKRWLQRKGKHQRIFTKKKKNSKGKK